MASTVKSPLGYVNTEFLIRHVKKNCTRQVVAWVHSRQRLVEILFTVSWDCHFDKLLFFAIKESTGNLLVTTRTTIPVIYRSVIKTFQSPFCCIGVYNSAVQREAPSKQNSLFPQAWPRLHINKQGKKMWLSSVKMTEAAGRANKMNNAIKSLIKSAAL